MTKKIIFKDEYELLRAQRNPHIGSERVHICGGFWHEVYFKFV